ncbi:MAG: hypothetical protein C4548_12995 [Desulfobacteraceae bacterium]|jgi:hypothetical protein|nr:MAG: hypothetical protein C4548_12995 [Desulfobacteraceae bacterium]
MQDLLKIKMMDNYLDCYGDFNLADTVCRKYCALRLRCAIEQQEQMRIEQFEDMMSADEIQLKLQ